MLEIIRCPSCDRRLHLPEECIGADVLCPGCNQQFVAQIQQAPLPLAAIVEDSTADAEEESPPFRRTRSASGKPRRRRRPESSGGWGWRVVLLPAGILLVVVVGVGLLVRLEKRWHDQGNPIFQVPANPPVAVQEQDPEPIVENQKELAPDEIAAEVKPLLEDLGKAFRARDRARIARYFDWSRMCDELFALEMFPKGMAADRQNFEQGFRRGADQGLLRMAQAFQWDAAEIRQIKKLPGPSPEAEVVARHQAEQGIVLKIRWWLTKRHGTWQVFDFEDLDMGVRVSTTAGITFGALKDGGIGNLQGVAMAVKQIGDAVQDVAQRQNPNAADLKLQQAAGTPLPKQLDAIRFTVTALVRLNQQRNEDALAAADKAHGLNPDIPCLDLLKGTAYNRLAKWELAHKHLAAYQKLLGDDANVCHEVGYSLHQLRRYKEAAVQYRKSLDFLANQPDTYLNLLQCLGPGDKKDDLGARFRKLAEPHKHFETCASDCRQARDGEELEQLATAMAGIDPNYASAYFYQALAKALMARPELALPLYKKAIALEHDAARRKEFTLGVLQALADAGKALDAYAAAPDPREAFAYLAAELKKTYRADDLEELLDRHDKKYPNDALVALYRADAHGLDGDYELADKEFSKGLAKPLDAATMLLFRPTRVTAKYQLGQAVAALADIGPRRETFQQLVNLCSADQDYDLWHKILDEEAKVDPDNPVLAGSRMLLDIRQNKIAEAVILFRKNLDRDRGEEARGKTINDFLFAMVTAGKFHEGYEACPDADQAFVIAARDLLTQNKKKDLSALLEAHQRKRPTDAMPAYYQAQLHLRNKAWGEAAALLQQVRPKIPAAFQAESVRTYLYAMAKAGRSVEAYKIDPKTETFNQLAMNLIYDKKGAELESLVAAHRPLAGDDLDYLNMAARAKILTDRPKEAALLFQKAYQKQPDEFKRQEYARVFVSDMAAKGLWFDAYKTVPDKQFAFVNIAGSLLRQKKEAELGKLLSFHRLFHAGNSWYRYYLGEWHLMRGATEAAEKEFAAIVKNAAANDLYTFRSGLYRARIRLKRTVQTYRENKPGKMTFETLANLCATEKNGKELRALVDAHRQAHPNFANAVVWELENKWLSGDFADTFQFIDSQRSTLLKRPGYRWKAESYLVRSLVQLKKNKEALKEAQAIVEKQYGNRILLVLAQAAAGDVKGTLASVANSQQGDEYFVGACYRDPDLGPLLRSPAFDAFRQRYPETRHQVPEFIQDDEFDDGQ